MTRITLALLLVLASPAMGKDKSRVPATGGDFQTVRVNLECKLTNAILRKAKKRRHTEIYFSVKGCHLLRGDIVVSWANVFRDMETARLCGAKPFRLEQCNG